MHHHLHSFLGTFPACLAFPLPYEAELMCDNFLNLKSRFTATWATSDATPTLSFSSRDMRLRAEGTPAMTLNAASKYFGGIRDLQFRERFPDAIQKVHARVY